MACGDIKFATVSDELHVQGVENVCLGSKADGLAATGIGPLSARSGLSTPCVKGQADAKGRGPRSIHEAACDKQAADKKFPGCARKASSPLVN